ncbi:hypothetical protein KCP74_18345 [Salmonella enterica subsp. enterica]|nr:hypothetical protein KCP74_18345 [Salmonella enterica subsp. enterica]
MTKHGWLICHCPHQQEELRGSAALAVRCLVMQPGSEHGRLKLLTPLSLMILQKLTTRIKALNGNTFEDYGPA